MTSTLPDALREASRLHKQGHLDRAAQIYRDILAANPRQVEALHLLSLIEMQRHDYASAFDHIQRLLAIDPRNASALLTCGIVQHRLGRLESTLECYNRALKLRPDFASAHNNRGNVLRDLKRPLEALDDYSKAVHLKPGYPEAWNNRSVVLRELGRLDEALSDSERALVLKPDYAEAFCNRGNILADQKNPFAALQSYEAALGCNPLHVHALHNKASVLRSLKRHDEALATFDQALAQNPDDAETHNNRGNVLTDLGRTTEAMASYDKALALNPHYAEAHNNKGLLLTELGRLDEARVAIEQAIALAPDNARFYYNLTEYSKLAPGNAYVPVMERLAEADLPTDGRIDIHFALGKTHADFGDRDRSFHHLHLANGLKFEQMGYDEAGHLDMLARIREAFPADLMRAHATSGLSSPAPIFIIGMPRSGSTLIEQVLASHPLVFAAGEIDDFDRSLQELPWLQGNLSPESLAALPVEAWHAAGSAYLARMQRAAPKAERITNKKLNNFRIAGLIHLALPQARIIHTRRNAIDTCVSCFSKQFVDDMPFTYSLPHLGRYYRAYENLMAHWRSALPPDVMLDVQYEEVVTDFEGAARRVLAHCGLPWDPRCLEFHKAERAVRTASKTQVREPIFTTSTGRWRAYEKHLGPLFEALGLDKNAPAS